MRSFDLTKSLVIDDLHTIYLGVVKKILQISISKKIFGCKEKFDVIDEELAANRGVSEISAISGLQSISDWKGKQFMSWLLYHGLPFLIEYAPTRYVENFTFLQNAIYNFSLHNFSNMTHQQAIENIEKFLETFTTLFGEENFGPNVHELYHLGDTVRWSGQLYCNSTFHFERINFILR